MRRTIRISFTRNELCHLIDALEDMIEDYGRADYYLVEDEDKLRERLQDILYKHDGVNRWGSRAGAAGNTEQ